MKIKKYRTQYRQFIAEGDKIVGDILREETITIRQLIATGEWLESARKKLAGRAEEIIAADIRDIARISSLETPPTVLALIDMPDTILDYSELSGSWSLALDNIQDPGNLGTIIRTADWFGIRNILCNEGCVDGFNPKVVQASMGALFHVKLHYTELRELLKNLPADPGYSIYGTFTEGISIHQLTPAQKGVIVFGNESRGISDELLPLIRMKITIPSGNAKATHVESLNVASAVAVVCSVVTRN